MGVGTAQTDIFDKESKAAVYRCSGIRAETEKKKKKKSPETLVKAKLSGQLATPKAELVWTVLWLIWIHLLIH